MTPKQALASALQFFIVFVFFALGIFLNCLPFLPQLRQQMAFFLLHQPEEFTLLGVSVLGVALLFLLGFYALNRGRFLRVRAGGHIAEVTPKVIRQTIEALFEENKIFLRDVEVVLGSRLEIGVALRKGEEGDLEKIEQALRVLLEQRFGYTRPFHFIVKIS